MVIYKKDAQFVLDNLELFKALVEGKIIQRKKIKKSEFVVGKGWIVVNCDEDWMVINHIDISFEDDKNYNYRVKPEPKLVPLDHTDNLLDKWVIHKDNLIKAQKITKTDMSTITLRKAVFGYPMLLKSFTFLDGSPCGKWIEE